MGITVDYAITGCILSAAGRVSGKARRHPLSLFVNPGGFA